MYGPKEHLSNKLNIQWWDRNTLDWLKFWNDWNFRMRVCKQIEATYQGLLERNFPIKLYHKEEKEEEKEVRLFNHAQLTENEIAVRVLSNKS